MLIPWEEIEKRYAKLFTNKKGNVAKALRLALGALIIQTAYGYSGEETARKRRKSVKDIRKAIGKQLRYIKRDFGYIDHMLKQRKRLSPKLEKLLQVLRTLYEQHIKTERIRLQIGLSASHSLGCARVYVQNQRAC